MIKPFYSNPKIEIRKDFIKLKEKNIKLGYTEIRSVSIRNARVERAGLIYIITGIIGFLIILCLFYIVLRGLFSDSSWLANRGIFRSKRTIIVLMFFFIGGPAFIYYKIKKYFRKQLMLIIHWDHKDFRIKIPDIKINIDELKKFFEEKIVADKLKF
jgi:hypothetical protein